MELALQDQMREITYMKQTMLGRPLSQAERSVAKLVAHGLQNKDIARQLELQERTVKCHLHHVMLKLGVKNRVQVALWCIENGVK